MRKRKLSFLSFAQASFITFDFFSQNDLSSHASACAFGFLFSFLPLMLMIFSILIMFASSSSELIKEIISSMPFFENTFNFEEIFQSLKFSGKVTIVQIIFGFWVFKMARNLFLYIQKGIQRIFRTEAPKRTVLNQILILAGEIILVLGAVVLILFNSLFNAAKFVPYILIFIVIFLTLKFYTGTRPPTKFCFLAAFLCTVLFTCVVIFLNLFLNFQRYSIIYGILGNLVILLFEVQIFFLLFFIFTQFIFVLQFFDNLLLAELYLLPTQSEKGILNILRRKLFISPEFLVKKFDSVKKVNQNEVIIKKGEICNTVYYIISGTITCIAEQETIVLERGAIFGEAACLLNLPRTADCIAGKDCKVLEIDGKTFRRLIDLNGSVAKKAISKLSIYLRQTD